MENTGDKKGERLPWHRRRGWLHPSPGTLPAPAAPLGSDSRPGGGSGFQVVKDQLQSPACLPKAGLGAAYPTAGQRPRTRCGTRGWGWGGGRCSAGRCLTASAGWDAVGSLLPVTQLKKQKKKRLKLSLRSRREV